MHSVSDLPPGAVAEIASILARGYMRYRKSDRLRQLSQGENDLDSAAEPSLHVTVVNAQKRGES